MRLAASRINAQFHLSVAAFSPGQRPAEAITGITRPKSGPAPPGPLWRLASGVGSLRAATIALVGDRG